MSEKSFRFTHAIVRRPGKSITDGLRAVDTGTPDLDLFLKHHGDYCHLLASTGATVIEAETLEDFPDSVFVEDAALCLREGAILMRPGAPSRLGEAEAMRHVLETCYNEVGQISEPAVIEGGDILVTEKEILVGLSARTSADGIRALSKIVSDWGYSVRTVMTPPDVLHFKTDCSLLDAETLLATEKLAASGCFDGYRVITTAPGEEAAANSVRFNDLVLMPDGFFKTADKLAHAGFDVRQVGNSQAAKLDGGMSCLSLRFSPVAGIVH